MNIFATDPDPVRSAETLDLKRVVKMILESYQLMSNALSKNGLQPFYKLSHINHPCSIWAAQSPDNYFWLYKHAMALSSIYREHYGKTHKCEMDHLATAYAGMMLMYDSDSEQPPQSFVNCTEYKHVPDVHQAYRFQMLKKWKNDKRAPTWPAGVDSQKLIDTWSTELENSSFKT